MLPNVQIALLTCLHEGCRCCCFTNNHIVYSCLSHLELNIASKLGAGELFSKESFTADTLALMLSEALVITHFAAGAGGSLCCDVLRLSSRAHKAPSSSCIVLLRLKV